MINGPRITDEDRGVTINKSLFMLVLVPLVSFIFWFGTITSNSKAQITTLQERQTEDRELIRDNQLQINILRTSDARIDQRLMNIEQSQTRQEGVMTEILQYLRNPDKRPVPSP